MDLYKLPEKALEVLFQDAVQRDPVSARRKAIFTLLLHERYLTREQIITRVEDLLGKGCFGLSAWEDVFFRDMQVVKKAFQASGYQLSYSRSPKRQGYFLVGQPAISSELAKILKSSMDEIDPVQIRIMHNLSPAQRARIVCSAIKTAINAVAFRYQQQHPELSIPEARRQIIQRGQLQ